MVTLRLLPALLLSLGLLTAAVADGKQGDKKSKIPPLTMVGTIEGQIAGLDNGSDRLIIKTKKIAPTIVPNYGPLSRIPGSNQKVVMQEKIEDVALNLSPDVKIRLMNKKPEIPKPDKKSTPKASGKKDPKKDMKKDEPPTKESKDENAEKGDDEKPEKDPDAKLGGVPGKKNQLTRGQIVKVVVGRNNDPVNPQNYAMIIFVYGDGK
jgi:hypothetical protein